MKVDDLYSIVRELKQIHILQANLLTDIKTHGGNSELYNKQLYVYDSLHKVLENYDKYTI
jgi:hypothetical protein